MEDIIERATSPEGIAVLAAMASWIAAIVALRSSRTARQHLHIALRQESRREPALGTYLHEAISYRGRGERRRILAAHILIRNPTDTDNAITDLELRVGYSPAGAPDLLFVKLRHDQSLVESVPGVSPLEIPQRIGNHGAVRGWALFDLPDDLLDGGELDDYEVVITDSHGIQTTSTISLFRELTDNESQNGS